MPAQPIVVKGKSLLKNIQYDITEGSEYLTYIPDDGELVFISNSNEYNAGNIVIGNGEVTCEGCYILFENNINSIKIPANRLSNFTVVGNPDDTSFTQSFDIDLTNLITADFSIQDINQLTIDYDVNYQENPDEYETYTLNIKLNNEDSNASASYENNILSIVLDINNISVSNIYSFNDAEEQEPIIESKAYLFRSFNSCELSFNKGE